MVMSDPTHSSSFPGPVFLLDEAGIQWRDDSGQTLYAEPDEGGLSAAVAGIAAAMRARVVVMGGQTWRERVDAHLAPVAARVEWVERSCLFAQGVDSGPVIYLGSEIWAYAAPTWHCVHQAAVLNQALFAATAGIERLATTQVPLTHNGFGQNTAGAVTAGVQAFGVAALEAWLEQHPNASTNGWVVSGPSLALQSRLAGLNWRWEPDFWLSALARLRKTDAVE
jgi:hypothetical protein